MKRIIDHAKTFFPTILVLQLVLGYLNILDALNVAYFPTIDNMTLAKNFNLGFNLLIPILILLILWVGFMSCRKESTAILISLGSLSLVFFIGSELTLSIVSIISSIFGLLLFKPLREFASNLMIMISGVSLLSLIHWAVLVPIGIEAPMQDLASFWLDIFYLHSPLAPLLVLPFLFFWLIKNMASWFFQRNLKKENVNEKGSPQVSKIILVFSLVLAVYSAFYPYLSNVNPDGKEVGVDIPSYADAISGFESEPRWLEWVLNSTRPLFYLVIMGFRWVTRSTTEIALRYFPVCLNPLLVASMYYLGYETTENSEVSSYAAFFTATGFPLTAGTYSYYLTNNLGLVLVSLSLGLLFRAVRRDSLYSLGLASTLGFMLAYSHPWTLDQYMAGMAAIMGLTWYRYYKTGNEKKTVKMLAIYLGAILLAELVKITSGGYGGVEATSTAISHLINIKYHWFSSIYTFRHLYGGVMSNLLLLGLAMMGQYYYSYKGAADEYFRWFLFLTSLVFILSDGINKSRLLYNTPFGLYASLGLEKASNWMDSRLIKGSALLYSTTYLFMCLENLV